MTDARLPGHRLHDASYWLLTAQAHRTMTSALQWAAQAGTDGHIPTWAFGLLTPIGVPDAIAQELVARGHWTPHPSGDGYQADWSEQSTADEVEAYRQRKRENQRRYRERLAAQAVAGGVTGHVAGHVGTARRGTARISPVPPPPPLRGGGGGGTGTDVRAHAGAPARDDDDTETQEQPCPNPPMPATPPAQAAPPPSGPAPGPAAPASDASHGRTGGTAATAPPPAAAAPTPAHPAATEAGPPSPHPAPSPTETPFRSEPTWYADAPDASARPATPPPSDANTPPDAEPEPWRRIAALGKAAVDHANARQRLSGVPHGVDPNEYRRRKRCPDPPGQQLALNLWLELVPDPAAEPELPTLADLLPDLYATAASG